MSRAATKGQPTNSVTACGNELSVIICYNIYYVLPLPKKKGKTSSNNNSSNSNTTTTRPQRHVRKPATSNSRPAWWILQGDELEIHQDWQLDEPSDVVGTNVARRVMGMATFRILSRRMNSFWSWGEGQREETQIGLFVIYSDGLFVVLSCFLCFLASSYHYVMFPPFVPLLNAMKS